MSDKLEQAFGARRAATPEARADAPRGGAPAPDSAAGATAYRAYGYLPAGNIGETCDVQGWIEGTDVAMGLEFQYRFLMQVGYVGEEQLKLFLPDSIIVIEGKNLRELRKKLARRQVTFMQQYTGRIWPQPPEAHEAIVTSVKVMRPDRDEATARRN